jgi:hypothetical protein
LEERKAASVRLSKLYDAKLAVAVQLHGLGRILEEATAERGESLVLANCGEPVVVLVDRNGPAEEPALEKAGDKLAQECCGLDRIGHA